MTDESSHAHMHVRFHWCKSALVHLIPHFCPFRQDSEKKSKKRNWRGWHHRGGLDIGQPRFFLCFTRKRGATSVSNWSFIIWGSCKNHFKPVFFQARSTSRLTMNGHRKSSVYFSASQDGHGAGSPTTFADKFSQKWILPTPSHEHFISDRWRSRRRIWRSGQ